MLLAGPDKALAQAFVSAAGATVDTASFTSALVLAHAALDAGDPIAAAGHLSMSPVTPDSGTPNPKKLVLLAESGADARYAPARQEQLAVALFGTGGLDGMHHAQSPQSDGTVKSTYFPTADQDTLFYPLPSTTVRDALQLQIATFLASDGATITAPK
jgi:hypothetical protein